MSGWLVYGVADERRARFGVAVRLERRAARSRLPDSPASARGRSRAGARGCRARSSSRRPRGSRRAPHRRSGPSSRAAVAPAAQLSMPTKSTLAQGLGRDELHDPDAALDAAGDRVAHLRRLGRHDRHAVDAVRRSARRAPGRPDAGPRDDARRWRTRIELAGDALARLLDPLDQRLEELVAVARQQEHEAVGPPRARLAAERFRTKPSASIASLTALTVSSRTPAGRSARGRSSRG